MANNKRGNNAPSNYGLPVIIILVLVVAFLMGVVTEVPGLQYTPAYP